MSTKGTNGKQQAPARDLLNLMHKKQPPTSSHPAAASNLDFPHLGESTQQKHSMKVPNVKFDRKGAQPISIAVNHERKAALASSSNRIYESKAPKASHVYDAFVEAILRKGGYLNSVDILNGLQDKIPDLDKMQSFKDLQNMNKQVHCAVTCYWNARSVRTYFELQEFVLDKLKGYKQMATKPKSFSEFGLGSLAKNEVVLKYFDLYNLRSDADLPNISTEGIVQCMLDFLRANPAVYRVDSEGTAENKFKAHLRKFLRTELTGVNVDFKSLFYSTQQSRRDWFKELTDCRTKYGKEYKEELCVALDSLVAAQTKRAVVPVSLALQKEVKEGHVSRLDEPFLRSVGVNAQQMLAQFQAIATALPALDMNCNNFIDLVPTIISHRGINRKAGLSLGISAVETSGAWLNLTDLDSVKEFVRTGGTNARKVMLASSLPAKTKELLVSAALGFVSYLISSRSAAGADEIHNTEDADWVNRDWFRAHLLEDVPEVFLTHVRALLKKIVNPQDFIRIVAASGGRGDRATLDWMQVKQKIESLLDGTVCNVVGLSPHTATASGKKPSLKEIRAKVSRRKSAEAPAPPALTVPTPPDAPALTVPTGSRALLVADYLAVLTIAVVYNRVLVAELPSKLQQPHLSGVKGDTGPTAGQIVCDFVARSVNETLVDSAKLAQLAAFSEEAGGPTAAIVSLFLSIERTLLNEYSVPSFECTRLGGSFLHFLASQLSTFDGAKSDASSSTDALREAVQRLHKVLSPASTDENGRPDADLFAERTDIGQDAPTNEALLAAVSTHLSAVLSSREFAQDTSTDGGISSAATLSVASQITQLLSEVEQRVQETEGFWSSASSNSSASFLNIATALLESDPEVAQRVQHLLALPQVSDVVKTQVDFEEEEQGSLQMHRSVSVELAMQAVVLNVASGHCLSIFDSLQQCKDSIAQVLVAAFHVPLNTGLRQADRVFRHLKGQGMIHFDESRGSVEICTSQASTVSSVLTFASPTDAPICGGGQDDKMNTLSSAWTENMIELLRQTPLGTSCAEFTLWAEQQSSVDTPSIAEFILQHQVVLQSRRPLAEGVTFFVVPGTDDCMPLPQGIPSVEISNRLMQALQTKQYSLAASYCMAASMALIDEATVSSAVNAFFLQSYESFGADAMDRLSDLSLQLASALPRTCRAGQCAVLRLCLKALAAAGKINSDTAQHCVWQAALWSGASGLHLVRLLVSTGVAASVEFPVFAQCAKEWSTNGVSIISRATAESERRDKEASAAEASAPSKFALREEPSQLVDVVENGTGKEENDSSKEDGETASVVPVSEQKALILNLLEQKYHYTQGGLVRPAAESPEGRQLQQAMMLLSATLYSSQVHFVMELIQNADDNTYLPGVTPTIRLELFPHAVVVYNNEQGFSDKNIKAICDVGGSTKANKTGYIGQKGIGFKSVFSISDVPEVHSNGYHIAFRREVSMLEPQWLDPTSESQWPSQYDSSGTYYETCLRLKLDAAALKNLAKLNQDIQAVFNGKLILFLNKLERMVLEDRMRNQMVEHCRTRLSDNWMRISIEASTSASTSSSPVSASTLSEVFWLVMRHKFSPTVRRMEVVVAETEVAIAFKFIKTGRRFKSIKKQQQVQSASEMALVEALEAEADQYNENHTSKQRNGKQGGGTQLDFPVDEDEQIRLDFSEGLMPVYAYLPTSTCCFRFMVQGDFVLPTNRESILEQNEWNLGLLNQVPRVFVQAITEMSRWCEAESQALVRGKASNNVAQSIADFPVLSQLAGSAYRLLIEPADLLRALPRRREATRDYIEGVVSKIYKELRAVPCLQSRSGSMCAPSQLVAVHHLDFDPATFVSEELLLAATGCQYAMHDIGAYELDNDLVADLGVRIFDISCIVECLQYLSSRINDTRSTVHDAIITKQIASAVLGLDTLLRVNFQQKQTKDKVKNSSEGSHTLAKSTSALTSTQRSLKPSQLFTRALPVSAAVSTIAYTLEPAVRDLLRQLCIWPTSTGTFVTLEHTLLLVQKRRGGAAFTSQQQECLNEFKDRLHMIDASLLDAAAACTTQGADLLTNFLVDNFKQARLSGGGAGFGTHSKTGLGTELCAQFSGGVEELTADIVLKRVILPAYKRFAEQQKTAVSTSADDAHPAFEAQETKEAKSGLDRRTAAAFVAFLFHSNWATKLNMVNSEYAVFVRDVGVVVPVLTAREGNRGLAWTNKTSPSLKLVRKMDWDQLLSEESIPQTEVHLGLELSESASSVLAALHTTTALRQLSWQVLDPLAACLMLGSGKVSLDQNKEAYTAAEVNAAFRTAQGQEDMKQWKEFLVRLGLVNFFGVYKTAPSQFKALSLYRLMDHLLRNGFMVNTSKQSALTDDFLPLFLPSSARDKDNVNPSVVRVTQDVHNSLLKIAELITLEVLQVSRTKAASSVEQGSAFLADLDRRCWLPIEVHEKLRDGSFGTAHGHFVCAPRHVISTHAEKSSSLVWYFGAHCAYLPHKLASNPAFRSLFHFHEISSKDSPSSEFLIGYLTWLCEQTEVSVFSSVRFMRWFYEEVKTNLLNSENAHASSFVQQRLTALLQNDAALVWIPDQVQLSPQTSATAGTGAGVVDPYHNESFSACYAGKMFPLSRLVKRDPSEQLHFDASPVKSLALFYADSAVMDLFARTQYCKTCQAVEGMFGVRGGSDYSLSFPQLRCTCVQSKDSRLSSLLSLEKGVVRNSPGAVDLADTLLFYCKELVDAEVEEKIEGGAVTLAPKRLRLAQMQALEGEKSEARAQADRLLNALSMNVWKCFQIQHSLHPYSSAQLHELKNYFLKHALLPITAGQKYVCALPDKASHVLQVALDDLEAFKLFEPELAALQGSVEWLQVFSADSPEVDNVFEEDGGSSAYDLDALKESEQHLLQLPASEFRTAVGTIPKQTFLAPSNKLALYEFLGIKKFSDHIQESWIKEPSAKQTKTGPAATLVGILNNLLTYAQAHYHHREQKKQQTPQLSQFDALQVYNMVTQLGSAGTRVHSLMQMEVVECRVLQRRLALALGDLRAENVLDATHHREFTTSPAGTRTNTLYVSAQLSAAEVQNLAVSLLTKALRVEVALLEQRHDVEDRTFLRQKFDFVAKVTKEQFQTILGSDNLSVLPSELTPWCMQDINVTEEVDLEEDNTENNAAVEAYQNLRKAKKEKQNQQAGKVAPKTDNDLKFEAYRKEQAEKMKAEGEASAAVVDLTQQVAEVAIAQTPAHVGAVLPREPSAKETPKVINDDLAPMGRVKNTSAVLGVYDGPNTAPAPVLPTTSAPQQPLPDNLVPLDPPLPPLQPADGASVSAGASMEHHLPQPPSVSRSSAATSYSNSISSLCGTYSFLGQAPRPQENFPQGAPTDRPQHATQHVNLTHVYQPRQLQPPPNGVVDVIYCDQLDEDERSVVTIPEEPISALQEVDNVSDEGKVQQFANRRQNFVSGRIGEALAVRHLRRRLLQQRNDNAVPCTAVRWLNEHTESGLPFDIELTFADGSVKHCEVKTQQSSLQQMQAPSQWLMSPAEVAQAHLERQGYFCVFVSLRIDYITYQVEDLQTRIVGYEQGLTAAIYCDQAALYIQTNC